MSVFWKMFDWFMAKLNVAGAFCLMVMMLLTCADVIGRIFRHPIFGSVEIVAFMATLTIAFALPYTHKLGGHIGVEILVRMLGEKTQKIIDICTGIVSLFLFLIITWRMMIYAGKMREAGEVSMNLRLPEHLVVYALSICLLITTLAILQEVIQNIKGLSRK